MEYNLSKTIVLVGLMGAGKTAIVDPSGLGNFLVAEWRA